MNRTLKALLLQHAFEQMTYKDDTIVPMATPGYAAGWKDAINDLCRVSTAFEKYTEQLSYTELLQIEELIALEAISLIVQDNVVSVIIAAGTDAETIQPENFAKILELFQQFGEIGLQAWVSVVRNTESVGEHDAVLFKEARSRIIKPPITTTLQGLLKLEKVSEPALLRRTVESYTVTEQDALEYLLENNLVEMETNSHPVGAQIKTNQIIGHPSNDGCAYFLGVGRTSYTAIQRLHILYGDDGVLAWISKQLNKQPKPQFITTLFVKAHESL